MTSWERQTLDPISMRASESSQTPSPIQELSPMLRCHGYLMLIRGFSTTSWPIVAPKARKRLIFHQYGQGKALWKNMRQTSSQATRTAKCRPGTYQALENDERSTDALGVIVMCRVPRNRAWARPEAIGTPGRAFWPPGPTCTRSGRDLVPEDQERAARRGLRSTCPGLPSRSTRDRARKRSRRPL